MKPKQENDDHSHQAAAGFCTAWSQEIDFKLIKELQKKKKPKSSVCKQKHAKISLDQSGGLAEPLAWLKGGKPFDMHQNRGGKTHE